MVCIGIDNNSAVYDIAKLWHEWGKIVFTSFKWQISVNTVPTSSTLYHIQLALSFIMPAQNHKIHKKKDN